MSIENIKAVWDHSRQSGTKRLVMIALADMANADGYCWPSIPLIARMCKCTNRYIMKIIPDLEASGELYVDHRPGRTRGNIYMLTLNVSVDSFAKRLIHYLDYGPTEALSIALTHLGKGEHESQTVNPSSPLPQKLKVNNSREKVNNSREKVNNSREKVNPSSPDPIEPIRTVIEPSFIDQGVGSKIATPPTPAPPATPKVPLLPNDGYEIPNPPTNGHTKRYTKVTKDYYDPRRLVDGYIPAGQGTTAIEVYHEWVAPSARRLSQPNQTDIMQQVTDLERWRTAVKAWVQAGHKPEGVGGMLDWYNDPSRLPSVKFAKPANGAPKAQPEVTFKQWLLNTYHSTFTATIKPESELRDEYRQWRKANGLPPAG